MSEPQCYKFKPIDWPLIESERRKVHIYLQLISILSNILGIHLLFTFVEYLIFTKPEAVKYKSIFIFTTKFQNVMKNLFFFFLLASGLLISCQGDTSADAAKTTDKAGTAAKATDAAKTFTVDTGLSLVNWEGYKPGQYGHKGTIKLQSGKFKVKDGKPESGSFVIDMTSLESTDLADAPDKKAKLEGHLKSGDFFEVEKYPMGKFTMTEIAPLAGNPAANYTIKGNLVMKDITKGIEIPAKVMVVDGKATITTPEFTINRTDWDIKFASGIAGAVKEQLIADDVKMSINLIAETGAM